MKRWAGVVAFAAAILMPGSAIAQQSYCFAHDLPPRYQTDAFFASFHVRFTTEGNKRILVAEGGLDEGAAQRFAQGLSSAGAVDEIWFNSPGGLVDEGLTIGRKLRASGAFVRIPANFACISACTLAFLGGTLRQVDSGAYYGVHMFSGVRDPENGDDDLAVMLKKLNTISAVNAERLKKIRLAKSQKEVIDINMEYAAAFRDYLRDIETTSAK